MSKKIDKMADGELAEKIKNGSIDLDELNISKLAHRNAFLSAVHDKPNILGKITAVESKQFIKLAMKDNPDNFVYLKKEQYTDEFAQMFIAKRMESSQKSAEEENPSIVVQKSLDNKLVLNYYYVSPAGDEIYYFDNELQVPTSLKSKLKVTMKLVDAVSLINKLDKDLSYLVGDVIKVALTDILISAYKAYFNEYLKNNKVGYYTLCASTKDLEDGLKNLLQNQLKEYGIEITDFLIKKIDIPKDMQYKIEDLAFQIRQKRADIEADAEFAKVSLKNYEEKLSIEEKYPDAEHTLTEYEKDLALKRYLVKTGNVKEEKVDRSIKINKGKIVDVAPVEKVEDVTDELVPPRNSFRTGFIIFSVLALLISVIVMAAGSLGAGLIVLGISILVFGLIAAFNHDKFKNNVIEKSEEHLDE